MLLRIAGLLLITSSALPAAILFEESAIWSAPLDPAHQARITTTVFDNFNGDTNRYEFRYSVTNLSFAPESYPCCPVGQVWVNLTELKLFTIYNGYRGSGYPINELPISFAPATPGWELQVGNTWVGEHAIDWPFELAWLYSGSLGDREAGLLIRESATFGVVAPAGHVVRGRARVDALFWPDYAYRAGPFEGQLLVPGVPEPAAWQLLAGGLVALGVAAARRRR